MEKRIFLFDKEFFKEEDVKHLTMNEMKQIYEDEADDDFYTCAMIDGTNYGTIEEAIKGHFGEEMDTENFYVYVFNY